MIITGGAPPTDVTAQQTGVSTVLITWTAPSPPPTDGYQVQITRGSITTTETVPVTSYTKSTLQHEVYSIRVKSLTQHLPSEATETVDITVTGNMLCTSMGEIIYIHCVNFHYKHKGRLPPVISTPSPTTTSVNITWTQTEFSLPHSNSDKTEWSGRDCPLCPIH